jgi:hypothetical protein
LAQVCRNGNFIPFYNIYNFLKQNFQPNFVNLESFCCLILLFCSIQNAKNAKMPKMPKMPKCQNAKNAKNAKMQK